MQYELVTAPGWLMSGVFFMTLFMLVVAFEEPYIDQVHTHPINTSYQYRVWSIHPVNTSC